MSLRSKIFLGCLLLGFIASIIAGFSIQKNSPSWQEGVDACYQNNEEISNQIDCWFRVIKDRYLSDGTEEAFLTFEYIYKKYDTFSNTGCHRHAHRVGDYAYYYDYLNHKDLSQTDFPKNAVACGYGFYHGFFEHLIQDNPDPVFVTETCEYLREKIYDSAPAISQTCYHGAGHGFTLAQVDILTDSSMWSLENFVAQPLSQCESLEQADQVEISDCRQGVFNVVVDWMEDEEFGFSYDYEQPFLVCDTQSDERQYDCYYEMAQKLGGGNERSPLAVIDIIKQIPRSEFWSRILGVAIAGMVQLDPKGNQMDLVEACRELETELRKGCFKSLVSGLVEHNTSADNFSNTFVFCANEVLSEMEQTYCYDGLSDKLRRFYTEAEIKNSCETGDYPKKVCELF